MPLSPIPSFPPQSVTKINLRKMYPVYHGALENRFVQQCVKIQVLTEAPRLSRYQILKSALGDRNAEISFEDPLSES